jgi:hypothetical protein
MTNCKSLLTVLKRFFIVLKRFHYGKNYDFVPLPLPSRYRYTITVIYRRPPFPLLTVIDRYILKNLEFFEQYFIFN